MLVPKPSQSEHNIQSQLSDEGRMRECWHVVAANIALQFVSVNDTRAREPHNHIRALLISLVRLNDDHMLARFRSVFIRMPKPSN